MNSAQMDKRVELRKKYLETPGYKKFSDIYPMDNYRYRDVRDNYLFFELIGTERKNDIEHAIEQIKNSINWSSLYAYFDERMKMENEDPISLSSKNDVETVMNYLGPLRQKLCIIYDAF